jgi:hypothetical protein
MRIYFEISVHGFLFSNQRKVLIWMVLKIKEEVDDPDFDEFCDFK